MENIKLKKGYRLLVFYDNNNIDAFVGCISAINEPLEIEPRQYGRCTFYTLDNNNSFVQIIGTRCELEKIRGDIDVKTM